MQLVSQAELISEDILEESNQGIDSSTACKFNQIVYRDNVKGKTYSFRYFRTYKFDWRLLLNHPNGEPVECKCPRGRLHSQQCSWYHPHVINIPDIRYDLSTGSCSDMETESGIAVLVGLLFFFCVLFCPVIILMILRTRGGISYLSFLIFSILFCF